MPVGHGTNQLVSVTVDRVAVNSNWMSVDFANQISDGLTCTPPHGGPDQLDPTR